MSQEIAIIATNARPISPNMTYVREETITVSEPLTDAERLEYGKEEREVHRDLLKDWDKCEMVWVESTEPYREVLRRPMTAEERQGSFLEKPISVSPGDDDVIGVDAEEQQ